MLGIPIGLAYANASEWLIHKHILHGLGKDKKSFWSFHFHEHHQAVRRNAHRDVDYERIRLGDTPQNREILGLVVLAVAHAPLLPIAPFFTATVWYSAGHYWWVHRKSHLDPQWARQHLPWHYDHHMGPNQDANWCVTRPWTDLLVGTRLPYAGTERETKDIQRMKDRSRPVVEGPTPRPYRPLSRARRLVARLRAA